MRYNKIKYNNFALDPLYEPGGARRSTAAFAETFCVCWLHRFLLRKCLLLPLSLSLSRSLSLSLARARSLSLSHAHKHTHTHTRTANTHTHTHGGSHRLIQVDAVCGQRKHRRHLRRKPLQRPLRGLLPGAAHPIFCIREHLLQIQ
jgi:hypothetical protein